MISPRHAATIPRPTSAVARPLSAGPEPLALPGSTAAHGARESRCGPSYSGQAQRPSTMTGASSAKSTHCISPGHRWLAGSHA
jgi:hypothetical protein